MTGHIELGHYADSAVAGIGDNFPDLILSIVESVRTHFSEVGVPPAFDAESLIVGQVPVQDVEFYRRHSVQCSLHNIGRFEMAGNVDDEALPVGSRLGHVAV